MPVTLYLIISHKSAIAPRCSVKIMIENSHQDTPIIWYLIMLKYGIYSMQEIESRSTSSDSICNHAK